MNSLDTLTSLRSGFQVPINCMCHILISGFVLCFWRTIISFELWTWTCIICTAEPISRHLYEVLFTVMEDFLLWNTYLVGKWIWGDQKWRKHSDAPDEDFTLSLRNLLSDLHVLTVSDHWMSVTSCCFIVVSTAGLLTTVHSKFRLCVFVSMIIHSEIHHLQTDSSFIHLLRWSLDKWRLTENSKFKKCKEF